MALTRYVDHSPCQMIPPMGEGCCTELGRVDRKKGRGLCLCETHRKEYGKLTEDYRASQKRADAAYARVSPMLLDPEQGLARLTRLSKLNAPMKDARKCVEAHDTLVDQRREHHRRIFGQADNGHERWIREMEGRREEVANWERRLQSRKDALSAPREDPPQLNSLTRKSSRASIRTQCSSSSAHNRAVGRLVVSARFPSSRLARVVRVNDTLALLAKLEETLGWARAPVMPAV